MARTLPELRELYIDNAGIRDQFEILSICYSKDGEFATRAKFDKRYRDMVDEVWEGEELPFPILLDGDAKTAKAYGVTSFPTTLLINPEGKLVKWGDAAMLRDELKAVSRP